MAIAHSRSRDEYETNTSYPKSHLRIGPNLKAPSSHQRCGDEALASPLTGGCYFLRGSGIPFQVTRRTCNPHHGL